MALADEIIAMLNQVRDVRQLHRVHQHAAYLLKEHGVKQKPRLHLPLLGRLYLAISPYIFMWGLLAPGLVYLYYHPITPRWFDGQMALAAAVYGALAVALCLAGGRLIRGLTHTKQVRP